MNFKWDPRSYEEARRFVEDASGTKAGSKELLRAASIVIGMAGPLPCPSPSKDTRGEYRVALDERGLLQIQKRDTSGNWVPEG